MNNTLRENIEDIVFDAMNVASENGDYSAMRYLDEILSCLADYENEPASINETLHDLQKRVSVGQSVIIKRYGESKFGIAVTDKYGKVIDIAEGTSIERAMLKLELNETYGRNLY